MLGLGNSLSTGGAVSEVLPSDISNLAIWLKNDTGITSSGDPATVSQWDDSSGNSRHAVQDTSTEEALLASGGLDLSSVDPEDFYVFSEDTTAHLECGGSNAFTLSAVARREGTDGDDNAIIGGDGNSQYIAFKSEEQIVISSSGTGALASTFNFATNTWEINKEFVITITKDTSGGFIFLKDGSVITPSSTTNPTNTGADNVVKYLGNRHPGTTTGSMTFEGKIKELVIYSSQLTGGDLTNLNNYLTTKFASTLDT